jgi:predicted  nucleic acid-binding Zn-ribbon protein
MRLTRYVAEIANKRTEQLQLERQIRELQSALDAQTLQIDIQIAWDSELKNDNQRKAKRSHMMSAKEFQDLSTQLHAAADRHKELEIEIEQIRSTLSIRKLEMRLRIAAAESLDF